MSTADHDLIRACRQGDAGAWELVLDRYERLVFSIPLHYGLSTDEAADIAQTTFIILTQSLDNLQDDTRLGAWLATVARRHTWRWLARHKREAVNPEQDLAEDESMGSQGDAVADWERLEWLQQGLSALDERCRALIQALYFDADQPSYAEVAARLNMAVGSIGPSRARCLEQLKRILG